MSGPRNTEHNEYKGKTCAKTAHQTICKRKTTEQQQTRKKKNTNKNEKREENSNSWGEGRGAQEEQKLSETRRHDIILENHTSFNNIIKR